MAQLIVGGDVALENSFINRHGEHFITGALTVGALRLTGLINNEQIIPTLLITIIFDFWGKHRRELLEQNLPRFFTTESMPARIF